MKRILLFAILLAVFSACGNMGNRNDKDTETKFVPKEVDRKPTLTEAQREVALEKKRRELVSGVDYETQLSRENIRLSILQLIAVGDISQEAARRIGVKMLQMAAQNGITGIAASTNFVMGAEIVETEHYVTSTAPQRMSVKYDITYKVANLRTGDVYGTATQTVTAVGQSFEDATLLAVNEIKNTEAIQQCLKTSCDRIVNWYDENVSVIKNQVDAAMANNNFELASAILSSVPERAKVAMDYVNEKHPEVLSAMLHKHAADLLGQMEAEIACAGYEFKPEVGAYFNLIPYDCPEHAIAQQYYSDYEMKCKNYIEEQEAKEERKEDHARLAAKEDREAEEAHEVKMMQMQYEHEEKMGAIGVYRVSAEQNAMAERKIIAEYENQATESAFSSGDSDLFGGLIDGVGKAVDGLFGGSDSFGGLGNLVTGIAGFLL